MTYTLDGDAETLAFEDASARDNARKHLQQQPFVVAAEAWDEAQVLLLPLAELVER